MLIPVRRGPAERPPRARSSRVLLEDRDIEQILVAPGGALVPEQHLSTDHVERLGNELRVHSRLADKFVDSTP
jgi:hypothetical protein